MQKNWFSTKKILPALYEDHVPTTQSGSTSFWLTAHFCMARFVVALFDIAYFVAGPFWSRPFWHQFHKNNFFYLFRFRVIPQSDEHW